MHKTNCPECKITVTEELPGGLCPACLINVARRSARDLGETAAMPPGFVAPDIAELGQLFPELEVIELVGRGGMGAVYRVRQKNLDRIVALKVFLYRPDDPEFAARFQREARALARLNHNNIVTVHEFGSRENIHYLVMEFVDGLNLRQISSEEQLAPEMALQMVPQLCDALQYAHDQGVIHRDIKPENILLDSNGTIKIADFGLAKMTDNDQGGTLTHTRQVMGTLNYMAPEQRERPTEVDHRADIYSLGVVIYELLTGELPLGRFLPPSEKSELDQRLDEVVMRALEKEPNLRYQQASEFKTGFQSQGGSTTAAAFAPIAAPVKPVKETLDTPEEENARFMLTLLSGRDRKGSWRPGKPQYVATIMGGTQLDLTQVESDDIQLNLFTLMGGTEVIVPHDADVDVDGFILMGGTMDKIASYQGAKRKNIRIRSYGAMGGCEVKNASKPIDPTKPIKDPFQHYREPRTHELNFRNGLVAMYKLLATLIGFGALILFLLTAANMIDRNDGRLAAIITAIACGMFWAGLDYFRRIIGAGPEDQDEERVKKYYSSSMVGTLIRCAALVCGFACPILFIVSRFESGDVSALRFTAIGAAILSLILFTAAAQFEEFFYGKLKE